MNEHYLQGFVDVLHKAGLNEKEATAALEEYAESGMSKSSAWLGKLLKFKPGLTLGKNMFRTGRNAAVLGGLGTAGVWGAGKGLDAWKNSDVPGGAMLTRWGGTEDVPDVSPTDYVKPTVSPEKEVLLNDINPYARSWGGDEAVFGQQPAWGERPGPKSYEWRGAADYAAQKREYERAVSSTQARMDQLRAAGASDSEIAADKAYLDQIQNNWKTTHSDALNRYNTEMKSLEESRGNLSDYISRWNRVNQSDQEWHTDPSDNIFARGGRAVVEGLGVRSDSDTLRANRERVNAALSRQMQMNQARAAMINSRPQ